jgi:hypothetical protein
MATNTPISLFGKIPWTLLLILYLVAIHLSGIAMDGVAGYIFIGLGLFVLIAEFIKSGDVSATLFLLDSVMAVLSVVVSTALLVWLYLQADQSITFFHWFGYAIILGDAIISPFNAFRTALRNFGVGSG